MTAARELQAALNCFGINQIVRGSLVDELSDDLIRGWKTALDRARQRTDSLPETTLAWLGKVLTSLVSNEASDELRAQAAEAEAALRLSWIGRVERVTTERRVPTPDFRVDCVNVEVYCPQQHQEERKVVQIDLEQQLAEQSGPIRVGIALSHPTTGSGRRVDLAGRICSDPENQALTYPTNKLIDRLLSAKQYGSQFPDNQLNVLWLDLKHGLGLSSVDCVPLRSVVAKGTCFMGSGGVWHAFYGDRTSQHFPERCTLEWSVGSKTYRQRRNGWFRDLSKVAAVALSVCDGIVLFENPWASRPFDSLTRNRFFRLSELRPEFSWLGPTDHLQQDVASTLAKLDWIATLVHATPDESDASA